MTSCGIPTVTCVLLLLSMAALYGRTFAVEEDGSLHNGDVESFHSRLRRNPQESVNIGNKLKGNKRGPQGRIDDTTGPAVDSNANGKRSGNRKKDQQKKKPNSGGKIPPGMNRRALSYAEKIGSSNSQFAAKVLKAIHPKIESNTVLSPFSIHTALSMLLLGSRKKTEKEIISVLGLSKAGLRKTQVHIGYRAMLTLLANVHENVNINSANAVFTKPNTPIEAAFSKGLNDLYNAKFDSFKYDSPEGPEKVINDWVSSVTNDKIRDLLAPKSITQATSVVLVNAVFFNASWDKPFSQAMTALKPFHTLKDGVKDVQTMAITNIFNYVGNNGAEVIELPFRGERLAMYIILPSVNSSVNQIIEDLSNTKKHGQDAAERVFRNMEATSLSLELPKFKIETSSMKLNAPLQSMGIKTAFTDKADLSGISTVPLRVDDVIHKAFIDVNEKGTEASAATAILIARRSGLMTKSRDVKVNRPFVFAIRDKPTKNVLFVGAYVGPAN